MKDNIIDKIVQKIRIPNFLEIMVNNLSFSELQSLLLRLFELKSQKISENMVLSRYKSDRFVQPSDIDPILHRKLELRVFSLLAEDFEIIDLSPLTPLGSVSVLTNLNQNNVISTIRNNELASDTTNVLTLECAKRREELLQKDAKNSDIIKLCSSQRVTRAQPFDNPLFSAHFNLIALCTSGRDTGSDIFEILSLQEHIHFYLRVLENLLNTPMLNGIKLKIFDYDNHRNTRIVAIIKNDMHRFKDVEVTIDQNSDFGKTYYQRLRFMISLVDQEQQEFDIIDGGFTDWTSGLLQNKKERLLTSGLGVDFLIRTIKMDPEMV